MSIKSFIIRRQPHQVKLTSQLRLKRRHSSKKKTDNAWSSSSEFYIHGSSLGGFRRGSSPIRKETESGLPLFFATRLGLFCLLCLVYVNWIVAIAFFGPMLMKILTQFVQCLFRAPTASVAPDLILHRPSENGHQKNRATVELSIINI